MSYLTKSEKQMEFNMRKAQYYLGIQCSLSKGDGKEMKELMNELIDDALQEGRKQGALDFKNKVLNLLNISWLSCDGLESSIDARKYYAQHSDYLIKRIKELEWVKE